MNSGQWRSTQYAPGLAQHRSVLNVYRARDLCTYIQVMLSLLVLLLFGCPAIAVLVYFNGIVVKYQHCFCVYDEIYSATFKSDFRV